MGVFTDDMSRLGEEIASGRSSRKEMLQILKSDIATIKTDVGEMLTQFGKKRVETKQRMQTERSEFTSQLQHFAAELGEQVIDIRKGFHQERTDMLGKMNEGLACFMSALKSDVAQLQTGFKMRRSESKRQIRADLDAFLGGLKAFSQNMETTVGSMLAEFRSDRQGGRAAWKAKDFADPQPGACKPQETAGPGNDDLTHIPGIGSGRQRQLNRAGISTFAQLAQSTPAQLMLILGNHAGGTEKVEAWIAHAAAMVR